MNGESVAFPNNMPVLNPWYARLEQAIQVMLLIYIASLPFRQLLFVERQGFLILLGLLLIWSILRRQLWIVRTPLDLPLLAFVFWVGFTVPFASFPDYSVKEFGKLLQGVLIFYAVIFFLQPERQRNSLVYILVLMVAIVSGAGIYQFDAANYQATRSFLSSEVWLTTFLVMFIPLCWALAAFDRSTMRRPLFLIVGLLATACLLLTQSRAGLVALFVEAWLFAWLYRHRFVRITVGAVTGFALVVVAGVTYVDRTATQGSVMEVRKLIPFRTFTPSIEHRFEIWSFAFSEIAKHPVVGIGYGSETLRLLYPPNAENVPIGIPAVRGVGTHNIFLFLALHVGIPGLVCFLWFALVLIKELVTSYMSTTQFPATAVLLGAAIGVVGVLVRVQFDQMLVGTLAVLFWVLIGLAMVHSRFQRNAAHR
jgi:O-antigen ligase